MVYMDRNRIKRNSISVIQKSEIAKFQWINHHLFGIVNKYENLSKT